MNLKPEHQLNTVNSVVIARLVTAKPSISAKLERQHKAIIANAFADESAVRAPSGRLFAKGGLVSDAFNLINGMSLFLRKKGNPVPDMVGTTYQLADDIDDIQKEFDERRDKLDQLLNTIRSQYDTLVEAGQRKLGNLMHEVEYPNVDEFISEFRFEIKWLGQPSGIQDTVLGAVSRETAARIRAASKQSADDMLTEAHARLVENAITEMGDVALALTQGQRLRQERLDRLSKLADEIEQKNWLKLPQLHDTVRRLRSLHCQATDLPTEQERKDKAKAIELAKADATKTLAELGL